MINAPLKAVSLCCVAPDDPDYHPDESPRRRRHCIHFHGDMLRLVTDRLFGFKCFCMAVMLMAQTRRLNMFFQSLEEKKCKIIFPCAIGV